MHGEFFIDDVAIIQESKHRTLQRMWCLQPNELGRHNLLTIARSQQRKALQTQRGVLAAVPVVREDSAMRSRSRQHLSKVWNLQPGPPY